MRRGGFRADPAEVRAQHPHSRPSEEEQPDHSVWDEPGLSRELAGGPPKDALTYERWLAERAGSTSALRSWLATLAVALLAGPWAVLGAFGAGGQTVVAVMRIVLFGPVIEEMLKNGAALIVVERRPYLFRSTAQIIICALAGGLAFAAIENVLFLHLRPGQPSAILVTWRWTICVALHMGCSAIMGMGVARIWRDVWQRRARPNLALGLPYLATAAAVHGAYNALALVLRITRFVS